MTTPKSKKLEAVELYKQGAPTAEIFNELGIYPTTLYQILREYGIVLRSQQQEMELTMALALKQEPPNLEPGALLGGPAPEPEPAAPQVVVRRKAYRSGKPSSSGRGRKKQEVDPELAKLVVLEFEVAGKSAKRISKEWQIPYAKVIRVLHAARVEVVGTEHGHKYEELRSGVLADFNGKALTLPEIMAKWGITAGQLYRMLASSDSIPRLSKTDQWGKNQAIVEEVLLRIRGMLGVVPEGSGTQLRMDDE